MPAPGNTAGPLCAVDWSATDLGSQAAWPPALRLAVDMVHNIPLPMLLLWGARRVAVYNDAYAAFAGLRPASVPGGFTPAVLPRLLSGLAAELDQVMAGACLHLPHQELDSLRDGHPEQAFFDIHLTPVPGPAGAAEGVLLTLAPPVAVEAALADSGAATLRILVVEDNLDSQYLVCEMLKAFGHEADGVGHAEGALTMLGAQRYDVLFSDVSLPGMSGVELARQAVASQPRLQVIFASGYGDALLRHLEFPHQSLQKPYELEHLQQALARIAGQLTQPVPRAAGA